MEQTLATSLPAVLVVAAFSCSCVWYSAVDAAILLCMCLLSVSCARLIQKVYLRWRRGDRPRAGQQSPVGRATSQACWVAGVTAAVICMLLVVKRKSEQDWDLALLVDHWYLAVTALMVAVAFEVSGTPRAELADALAETQTNYSEGAAWLFFLGYLEKIFGDNGTRFAVRMEDYLGANEITDEAERMNTCKKRMFIMVPMKRVAILSDRDFEMDDATVKKERTLRHAAQEGGRNYGETRVYQVEYGGCQYRLAMEEATPLRTASLAVQDADADFDDEDYEEFAGRFLKALQEILVSKPAIGAQLELVPIYESSKLGSTVVKRFLALRQLKLDDKEQQRQGRPAAGQERVADELVAEGSVAAAAARWPEESSELFAADAPRR